MIDMNNWTKGELEFLDEFGAMQQDDGTFVRNDIHSSVVIHKENDLYFVMITDCNDEIQYTEYDYNLKDAIIDAAEEFLKGTYDIDIARITCESIIEETRDMLDVESFIEEGGK